MAKNRKLKAEAAPESVGNDVDSEDETTSSDEEPEWDDRTFLRTLGALKSNDAAIYDSSTKFWSEVPSTSTVSANDSKDNISSKKSKKDKPMYLKDYERKLVLEKKGIVDESDDDNIIKEDPETQPNYFDQQNAILKELKDVVKDDGDSDGDELFTTKVKTKEEKRKEEDDFTEWFKNQKSEDLPDQFGEMKKLKKAWTDPNIDEADKFLRDYLMNKDYEANDDSDNQGAAELEEDEAEVEKQAEFERKYNFRYENADQDFIKQYPRTVNESLRKENSKRKDKRADYKARKEQEKTEFIQEIKKKKQAAMSHIEKKLQTLKKLTGDEIDISLNDLRSDFDPKEYDRRMKELFDSKYYGDDVEEVEDEQKPEFSDMSDIDDDIDDFDEYDAEEDQEEHDDHPTEVAPPKKESKKSTLKECAIPTSAKKVKTTNGDEADENDEEEATFRRKESKRKRKRAAATEATKAKKPRFDPSEKTFEEYFNEVHALDYADIVGDQITKFKYREVAANDFGLTAEEILSADDRQLNKWVSQRKVTAYRTEDEERYDRSAYEKKGRDEKNKKKVFDDQFLIPKPVKKQKANAMTSQNTTSHATATEASEAVESSKREKKNKNKKIKKKATETDVSQEDNAVKPTDSEKAETKTPRKRNRNNKSKNKVTSEPTAASPNGADSNSVSKSKKNKNKAPKSALDIADGRLLAYAINPKKFKNQLKYAKKKEAPAVETA